MQIVAATELKNSLGEILDIAREEFVVVERHGRAEIALLDVELAKLGVLVLYSMGRLRRARAMSLLGFTWYGQLRDALDDAQVGTTLSAAQLESMERSVDSVFGVSK